MARVALRDGHVFAAAEEVAADRAASDEARVFAFRTLILALHPGLNYDYGRLASQNAPAWCIGVSPVAGVNVAEGAPLPEGYEGRVRAFARRVAADTTEPEPVRLAAQCALVQRAGMPRPGSHDHWAVIVPAQVGLRHVCGSTFVATNPHGVPMEVLYRVVETGETGLLRLPPDPSRKTPSETPFTPRTRGTVELWENLPDGERITSARSGRVRCR